MSVSLMYFFVKQKTAYEMRISDLSSDVCSSDLLLAAAVFRGDDHVLRNVHQATREVTGVRGLQRGIGQALAGAVRRDEVLQNVEAFTEVRGDRRLDDRAVRLGHQATHAGELTNLRLATTPPGVGPPEPEGERERTGWGERRA